MVKRKNLYLRMSDLFPIPVHTGRKLNVHKYVQFTSCVYGDSTQSLFSFRDRAIGQLTAGIYIIDVSDKK